MSVRKRAVLAALLMATPASAQSGWRMIGQARASADAASVTIAARDDGAYREFMVCLEDGAARLVDAELHYRDGRVQARRLRARIADGACGRAGSLSGRDRVIASLDVRYDPASLEGDRPKLQLFVR